MSPMLAAAEMVFNQVRDACVTMLLDWGEAINAAQALPGGSEERVRAEAKARRVGLDLQQLAMGLAARLRPRG